MKNKVRFEGQTYIELTKPKRSLENWGDNVYKSQGVFPDETQSVEIIYTFTDQEHKIMEQTNNLEDLPWNDDHIIAIVEI